MAMLQVSSDEPGKRLVLSSLLMGQALRKMTPLVLVVFFLIYACVGMVLFFGPHDENTLRLSLGSLIIPVVVIAFVLIAFVLLKQVVEIDKSRNHIQIRSSAFQWSFRTQTIPFTELDWIVLEPYRLSSSPVYSGNTLVDVASLAVEAAIKPIHWRVKAISKRSELILNSGGTETEMLDLTLKVAAITGARVQKVEASS